MVDVELTVNVEVAAPVPVMLTGDWTAQVMGLVAPVGEVVTAQLSATLPVKPFVGVTEIVEVLPEVAPAEILRFWLFVTVKPGVLDPPCTMAVMARVWTYKLLASLPVISTL